MYEDRLEGRLSPDMYDRKAKELRAQLLEILRRMNEIKTTAPAPVQGAIGLMDLTSRAANPFLAQPPNEKQGFLRLVAEVGALAAWAVAGRVRKPVPSTSPLEPAKPNEIRKKGDANR